MLKKNIFLVALFAFIVETVDIHKSNLKSTSILAEMYGISGRDDEIHFITYDVTHPVSDMACLGNVILAFIQKYPNLVLDIPKSHIYFINISVMGIRGPPKILA